MQPGSTLIIPFQNDVLYSKTTLDIEQGNNRFADRISQLQGKRDDRHIFMVLQCIEEWG
jgi:hypothetical protein